MKKNSIALFLVTVLFSCVSLYANPVDANSAVGVTAMGTTRAGVYGLQYQHWFNNRFGMQTEGFAYYNPDSNEELNYLICGEFLIKLYETQLTERSASNLFVWILAGHRGYSEKEYDYNTGKTLYSGFCPDALAGVGFGFDIMFLNHISFPVQFGFLGEFPYDTSVGFSLGTGIRYRF